MTYYEYNPRSTLYHYTGISGFDGIIESKSLWFTDIKYSNDPREIDYGYNNILNAFEIASQKTNDAQLGYITNLIKTKIKRYLQNSSMYCCCLTHNGDQLPMWSTYGDRYRGLSIGFRASFMADNPIRVQKVRYIEDIDTSVLVKEAIEYSKNYNMHVDEIEEIGQLTEIVCKMIAAKHQTWSYENEVRLTHARQTRDPAVADGLWAHVSGVDDKGELIPRTKLYQRRSVDGNIPYVIFSFGRNHRGKIDHSGAIEKVIVGPQCQVGTDVIYSKLQQNGYKNFTVERSKCSIR